MAPTDWAAAPDMALSVTCITSVALNVGSKPLDFSDLLCYLFSDAFKVLLPSILPSLRLLGVFTSDFTSSTLAV